MSVLTKKLKIMEKELEKTAKNSQFWKKSVLSIYSKLFLNSFTNQVLCMLFVIIEIGPKKPDQDYK